MNTPPPEGEQCPFVPAVQSPSALHELGGPPAPAQTPLLVPFEGVHATAAGRWFFGSRVVGESTGASVVPESTPPSLSAESVPSESGRPESPPESLPPESVESPAASEPPQATSARQPAQRIERRGRKLEGTLMPEPSAIRAPKESAENEARCVPECANSRDHDIDRDMRNASLLPVLLALACTKSTPPAVTEDPTKPVATSTTTTSPPPSTSASAGLPVVDTSCKTDPDCVIYEEASTGTYACCPFGNGCVLNAGNAGSVAAFKAACKATPAAACPPIGCAQPASPKAKCDGGKCVVAK
jgi:hypothetical protein